MGLGQTISEWIRVLRDTFDFGPEFATALAGQHTRAADELTQVQRRLEEARKACREKDELIARLEAALAVRPAPDAAPAPGLPARRGCASEPRVEEAMIVHRAVGLVSDPGDEAKPAKAHRKPQTRRRRSKMGRV